MSKSAGVVVIRYNIEGARIYRLLDDNELVLSVGEVEAMLDQTSSLIKGCKDLPGSDETRYAVERALLAVSNAQWALLTEAVASRHG